MAKPMSDFLSFVTADYDYTLDIPSHVELLQETNMEQFTHKFSDGQRGIVTLSNQAQFEVQLQWDYLVPANADIIYDLHISSTKANGLARSFYWSHIKESQVYTVKFSEFLTKSWKTSMPNGSQVKKIRLYVIGVKPV